MRKLIPLIKNVQSQARQNEIKNAQSQARQNDLSENYSCINVHKPKYFP